MTEAGLMREIMVALSADGHAVFRANVGLFFTKDGRPVRTGLPVGFSDLFGHRDFDARAFYCEVKTPDADATSKKERTKKLAEMRELGATQQQLRQADEWMRLGATPDQAQFLTAMRARGAIADVVRSVDDARQLLRRPL
jgi:hypothetical protein